MQPSILLQVVETRQLASHYEPRSATTTLLPGNYRH